LDLTVSLFNSGEIIAASESRQRWSRYSTHVLDYIKGFAHPLAQLYFPHCGTGSHMAVTTLLYAFFLALCSYASGRPEPLEKRTSYDFRDTCNQIAATISGTSKVFFPRERVILSFYDTPI
jgi:hypothetical protein